MTHACRMHARRILTNDLPSAGGKWSVFQCCGEVRVLSAMRTEQETTTQVQPTSSVPANCTLVKKTANRQEETRCHRSVDCSLHVSTLNKNLSVVSVFLRKRCTPTNNLAKQNDKHIPEDHNQSSLKNQSQARTVLFYIMSTDNLSRRH